MSEITADQIEQHNIETYEKYGTEKPSIKRHICTQCRNHVSIDCSVSNQGHRLVCNECVYSAFGSMLNAYDWVYGERESEEDG